MNRILIALSVAGLLLFSCSFHAHNTRAFYYWRTNFNLSASENETLRALQIERLYVRYFDVVSGDSSSSPVPAAECTFSMKPPTGIDIVPVVYITNKSLRHCDTRAIEALSLNIWNEANHLSKRDGITFRELQLDCDWTDSTQTAYFRLAAAIRKLCGESRVTLSATIRLHQVKYLRHTGVPPVDRGMLMFYNMGTLGADSERSSIFNTTDALKYVAHVHDYPLALDVALPIFGWTIHLRDDAIVSLIEKTGESELDSLGALSQASHGRYQVQSPFFWHGEYFRQNDQLMPEAVSANQLFAAANLISKKLRTLPRAVTLFDLDERNAKRYERATIDSVYHCFN